MNGERTVVFLGVLLSLVAGCGESGGSGQSDVAPVSLRLQWTAVPSTPGSVVYVPPEDLREVVIQVAHEGNQIVRETFRYEDGTARLVLPTSIPLWLSIEAIDSRGVPRFRGEKSDVVVFPGIVNDLGFVWLYPLETDWTVTIRRNGYLRVRVSLPALAFASGLMNAVPPEELSLACLGSDTTGWSVTDAGAMCVPFDQTRADVVFEAVRLSGAGVLRASFYGMTRDGRQLWLAIFSFSTDPPGWIVQEPLGHVIKIPWSAIPDL